MRQQKYTQAQQVIDTLRTTGGNDRQLELDFDS